jgi:hypothetical protein
MSRNPRITGAELIDALDRAGFVIARIRGSHRFLRHEGDRERKMADALWCRCTPGKRWRKRSPSRRSRVTDKRPESSAGEFRQRGQVPETIPPLPGVAQCPYQFQGFSGHPNRVGLRDQDHAGQFTPAPHCGEQWRNRAQARESQEGFLRGRRVREQLGR